MRRFADAYDAIDATTSTNAKVAALAAYLRSAPPADAAWGFWFLTGRRLMRTVGPRLLAAWAMERSGTPPWLFDESISAVGDLAETIALLLDGAAVSPAARDAAAPAREVGPAREAGLAALVEREILPLRGLPAEAQRPRVLALWESLSRRELFLCNKLLTGELRVGLSDTLAVRAVAQVAGLPAPIVAHRLMGLGEPGPAFWQRLTAPLSEPEREAPGASAPGEGNEVIGEDDSATGAGNGAIGNANGAIGEGNAVTDAVDGAIGEGNDAIRSGNAVTGTGSVASLQSADLLARPYPFFLASPLEGPPAALGERALWQLEWKWDGIRAQLVRRAGQRFLWSRGEELITRRFPDLEGVAGALPDGTVLDGEVLAFDLARAAPLPFALLQRRIGRQKLTPKILAEAPAAFMAYDLLEQEGRDLRGLPLSERRARLAALVASARAAESRLVLSAEVSEREAPTWEALAALRAESRARGVEGFMLKRRASPYGTGRRRGDWWKWKVDPFSIDAVLVYAQPGSGRRASLLTDLTFALWHEGALLPVAKAYSGLTDEELARLDPWIRAHTVERFGPVRAVEPAQVFELHFEGIAASARHKSGVAVRFPRIARWRTDKRPADADQLETLRRMIPRAGAG